MRLDDSIIKFQTLLLEGGFEVASTPAPADDVDDVDEEDEESDE
jgi:hypothetical protein